MNRELRIVAGLTALIAVGPLSAQEPPSLEAGLHAVLVHGDLLDVRMLSTALGIEISVPPAASADGPIFQGTATHVPPTMYATGLSYTVRVDKIASKTFVDLRFSPHTCRALADWAHDWRQQVRPRMFPDAAGSMWSIQWDSAARMSLAATYSTGGRCTFDVMQTFDGAVLPRVTEAPTRLTDTHFDREIAALVQHDDLRDYRWTAGVLHADLKVGTAQLRDGLLFKGRLALDQVIPGVTAASFEYVADDSGWANYPGAVIYLGQKLAERFVNLSFAVDTRQVCLLPEAIATSLQRAGVAYRATENNGTIRYDAAGDNPISVIVLTSRPEDGRCVTGVWFRQTTDAAHGINSPIEFVLRDALQADRLSSAAAARVVLVGQRLRGKTVKEIVISAQAVPGTAHAGPALARLAELLRTALVDQGVAAPLIRRRDDATGTRQQDAEAMVTVDVLVR